jgi:3',5'-cyclic AMP phosphodiesterase CpdA
MMAGCGWLMLALCLVGFALANFRARLLTVQAQSATSPQPSQTLRFAIIGDSGTGNAAQLAVAQAMEKAHATQPFDLVLMLGDNFYGAIDFVKKFERPYQKLLAADVKFYATLGNHDNGGSMKEMSYPKLNMGGRRYYTFIRGELEQQPLAQFFALDSTKMDMPQVAWVEKELSHSTARWKIAFFHHPLYSSGKTHGPDLKLRAQLEPLFTKYRVQLVLNGHEHFYERLKPQQGVQYFISGAAGKIRRNNLKREQPDFVFGNDQAQHFMLFEVTPALVKFRAISAAGADFDSGVLPWEPTSRLTAPPDK